jgi:YD repeat-containing protein
MASTVYGCFADDVFAPKDALSLSLIGNVAPATNCVPPGSVMFDGSISFEVQDVLSNVQFDDRGRVTEIVSTMGERTSLSYNGYGELVGVKRSNGELFRKRKSVWLDQHGARAIWKEIVALSDGTLWCKKIDGAIVAHHIDGTSTLQNVRQHFILWFDTLERLTAIRYPNGQSRSFTYADNVLSEVTEPDGSRFYLKDGNWFSEVDSQVMIDELRVVNDGTVIYRAQNHIVSTFATGKVKRLLIDHGDPGFMGSFDSIIPHSKIENRVMQQKLLSNCQLDIPAELQGQDDEYQNSFGRFDCETIEVNLYRIKNGKDLPLSKRLDLAAAEVSSYLFGTYPLAVVRILEHNPSIERTIVVEKSSSANRWLETKMDGLIFTAKKEVMLDELMQMVNQDADFRIRLEQVVVERLIIGGCRQSKSTDFDTGLLALRGLSVASDLEGAFDPDESIPSMGEFPAGLRNVLAHVFSESWLSVETSARISMFLEWFSSSDGKEHLASFGLYEDEIDSLIARTAWFEKHQKLPLC